MDDESGWAAGGGAGGQLRRAPLDGALSHRPLPGEPGRLHVRETHGFGVGGTRGVLGPATLLNTAGHTGDRVHVQAWEREPAAPSRGAPPAAP